MRTGYRPQLVALGAVGALCVMSGMSTAQEPYDLHCKDAVGGYYVTTAVGRDDWMSFCLFFSFGNELTPNKILLKAKVGRYTVAVVDVEEAATKATDINNCGVYAWATLNRLPGHAMPKNCTTAAQVAEKSSRVTCPQSYVVMPACFDFDSRSIHPPPSSDGQWEVKTLAGPVNVSEVTASPTRQTSSSAASPTASSTSTRQTASSTSTRQTASSIPAAAEASAVDRNAMEAQGVGNFSYPFDLELYSHDTAPLATPPPQQAALPAWLADSFSGFPMRYFRSGETTGDKPKRTLKDTGLDYMNVVPVTTLRIQLLDGVVEDMRWDEGCYGCGEELCVDSPGSVAGYKDVGWSVSTKAMQKRAVCSEVYTHAGQSPFRLYVAWTGTGKNGETIFGSEYSLSSWLDSDRTPYYRSLASYLPSTW